MLRRTVLHMNGKETKFKFKLKMDQPKYLYFYIFECEEAFYNVLNQKKSKDSSLLNSKFINHSFIIK